MILYSFLLKNTALHNINTLHNIKEILKEFGLAFNFKNIFFRDFK